MRLDEFNYELPEELIAQEPLEDRAASRMLHLDKRTGEVFHREFRHCLNLLEAGDLLVMNDTRVTARRLIGRKSSGAEVELLLLRPEGDGLYWCMAKPGKRVKTGAEVRFGGDLRGIVREIDEIGLRLVDFGPGVEELIQRVGQVPLPPYVHFHLEDEERYQTVYSAVPGSAAAPTAGLHFTKEILEALRTKGVRTTTVTLDVSIDTFRPVSAETAEEHVMHGEVCRIREEAAEAINRAEGRIIAVGTTSVRTLESFAVGQKKVEPGEMVSQLFITPGYEFKVVDGMFTNFHLPKTTMLLMLGAMAGVESVKDAYREAVKLRYRFLSFGDSMLLL